MNNKKQLDFQTIAVDFDGTLCYSKWPDAASGKRKGIDPVMGLCLCAYSGIHF